MARPKPYIEFGKMLRERLCERKTTMTALANFVGITPQGVQKWGCGETFPARSQVAKVAAFLEMDPVELAAYRGCLEGTKPDRRIPNPSQLPALAQAALDALEMGIVSGRFSDEELLHLIAKGRGISLAAD